MPASFRSEKKEHFVVKIQGSLATDEEVKFQKLDEEGPLLVRNKAGSLVGNLGKTENPSIHAELVAVLKARRKGGRESWASSMPTTFLDRVPEEP